LIIDKCVKMSKNKQEIERLTSKGASTDKQVITRGFYYAAK